MWVLDLPACRADGCEEAGRETRRWSMWGSVVLVRVLDWLHSGRRKLITARVVWEETSLVVQQLRLCALNAGGWGSTGQGTRSPCCNSRSSMLQWRLEILQLIPGADTHKERVVWEGPRLWLGCQGWGEKSSGSGQVLQHGGWWRCPLGSGLEQV